MIRLGINGFGRIGRQVLKAVLERYPETLRVVAINDLSDVKTNAHLFQFDTNYGRFPGEVKIRKDSFIINGQTIKSLSFRDPVDIPWDEEGVDIVIESTGLFLSGPKARAHLEAGARKVIITAPAKEEDIPSSWESIKRITIRGSTISYPMHPVRRTAWPLLFPSSIRPSASRKG